MELTQTPNHVKLSILVCTIQGREDKLKRLEEVLRPQLPVDNSVELIIKEELPQKQGGRQLRQQPQPAPEQCQQK